MTRNWRVRGNRRPSPPTCQAEAAVKGAMFESARLTVLLADHTKFGREAMFRYQT